MNASQRIEKAMLRVESASTELLRAAAGYGAAERGIWKDADQAREVLAAGREYAAAMRWLRQASRRAP